MAKQSAGIVLYRTSHNGLEFFLVHPGGPFFKNKDEGVWSIPKGEFTDGEEALAAARREFQEETGFAIAGDFLPLKPITQIGGKTVYAWAVQGDIDAKQIKSNTFEMEWPPKSGRLQSFPEVDKGGWFTADVAAVKIIPAQVNLLEQVLNIHKA